MAPERIVVFRFYEELNDFLTKEKKKVPFSYSFKINQTVKDAIEANGIPHTEVDLIVVNSESVNFSYQLSNQDHISVYPVFESIDISPIVKLRPDPLRETKFILDVHLGKLCKYLRMLGFDTYYRNDLEDPEIIDIAFKTHRIILTRDIGILKNGLVTHGYWVRSQDSKLQLKEVIRRFDLPKNIRPFYRCTSCNGRVRKIEKEKIENLLESNTRQFYNEFYQCLSCEKIYWEGSHYKSMRNFVEEIVEN